MARWCACCHRLSLQQVTSGVPVAVAGRLPFAAAGHCQLPHCAVCQLLLIAHLTASMTTSFLEGDAARGRVRIRKPKTQNTTDTGILQHGAAEGSELDAICLWQYHIVTSAECLLVYGFVAFLVHQHCLQVYKLVGMDIPGVATGLRCFWVHLSVHICHSR